MSKYPSVILFRHKKYSDIDCFIESNKDSLMCTIYITSSIEDLNKLFSPNYHLLVTYGDSYDEYHNSIADKIPHRFSGRWFHKTDISNIAEFNYNVNYCYVTNVINIREKTRPVFSIFTTCFKSYDYIDTAYESIKKQSLIDWEWVIMDDTPEDEHFVFLKNKLSSDNRVRLYKRDKNSGSIGNVKNEVISLCRGKYILEMDHDDEILDNCLLDSYNIFESDPEIGFVYGDTIHLYRNGNNFNYGDFICKGYGGYYMEKIKGKWVYVYNTPNINNITLSHLVCLPNHPRIWKRSVLMELESYSEFLPICDDYEILLRTCCSKYKVVKNNKAQYIQYMNDGGNNFSNIRNSEINRLGPKYISPLFYKKYGVHDKMKELDAYENEKYITNHSPIWKRGDEYQHKIMNQRINLNYDKQYCIINEVINSDKLAELYKNPRNDFLFLSNKMTHEELQQKLESLGFDRMKCYSFMDCSDGELVDYFKMKYVNDKCEHYIFEKKNVKLIITESDNNNDILLWDKIDVGRLAKEFYSGKPFKHIVLDKVINEDLLELAYKEITSISKNNFFNTIVIGMPEVQVNKYALTNFDGLKYIVQIKNYLESDYFLKILEKVTGIDNLQKDPTNNGGGLHFINYNGKLNIHSDFNRHKASKKYRRLNLLLYLNKDYKEEYNGHFEFWNKDMTSCEKKIAPLFNRIVLFKVDDNANHGHPELWKNPNNSRMSLALYYYTDDRPEHEKSETYHARWKTLQVPKQLANDTEVVEKENIVDENSKCYIIHNNNKGGAYKFLKDIMKKYSNYDYIFISSKKQLYDTIFNKKDIFILQNFLYTDIEVSDFNAVYEKNKFKLYIQIHDFQWLCVNQHNYSYKISNSYLDNSIDILPGVKKLLASADIVIMNSQFTYDVYSKYFDTSNFALSSLPDYNIKAGIKNIPEIKDNKINLGVFSPLCKYKGERYIQYLKNKYKTENINFCVVGQNIPYYNEEGFFEYLRKYNINAFLMLNEWGETYSYLLTKILNSGLPLLYNNFGALKERVPHNMDHYVKVFDSEQNENNTDFDLLDTKFNEFIAYIQKNHGAVEDMNEDFTIVTKPIYDELLLPIMNREIPKHIFQTSKEILPSYVEKLINIYCHDWKYSHFTDKECIQFFKENPISEFPNIIQKFHSFTQGQHKADLFRYYYLYLRGGVFLDSDAMFETNINNIIQDYDSIFAKSFMKNEHLFNGFIATYPRNKIIYNALKHAYNTENNTLQSNYHYLCEELLKDCKYLNKRHCQVKI